MRVALAIVALAAGTAAASAVIELDSSSFEHLTQASSGATTGDWFVAFTAPWCGHCKRLEPTWEELAAKLREEDATVSVARVDATASTELGRRFGVRGFPTLLFFHQGRMIRYKGSRALNDLVQFASGGWKVKLMGSEEVPPAPSLLAGLLSDAHAAAAALFANFGLWAVLTLIVVGFVAGTSTGYAVGQRNTRQLAAERDEALDAVLRTRGAGGEDEAGTEGEGPKPAEQKKED